MVLGGCFWDAGLLCLGACGLLLGCLGAAACCWLLLGAGGGSPAGVLGGCRWAGGGLLLGLGGCRWAAGGRGEGLLLACSGLLLGRWGAAAWMWGRCCCAGRLLLGF